MSKLTIILPCAGEGKRLGLPFSKELFSFEHGKCLIDYTFDLFSNYNREDIHFVITINEDKTDLFKYLSKYKTKFNISFTFFNPQEIDVPGSIKSAKHLFGENNLVLLPDTILKLKQQDIVTIICNELKSTNFLFLFKRETSNSVLKTKGALLVNTNSIVKDYEDKPSENIERFNAYWCAFAFKRDTFDTYINTIEKFYIQTYKKPQIKYTSLYNVKALEIEDYVDLGTWEEIYRKIDLYKVINC